jgi:hypothetical protein
MSHWAELDENNVVIRVLVGNNNEPNEGLDWINKNLGGTWVQTSYNGTTRKHFAAAGFIYDKDLDSFIPPKPYASWSLDKQTCLWIPPVSRPNTNSTCVWDEGSGSWVEVEDEAV